MEFYRKSMRFLTEVGLFLYIIGTVQCTYKEIIDYIVQYTQKIHLHSKIVFVYDKMPPVEISTGRRTATLVTLH